MKRTTFLAAALATTLAWATPSAADTILFDPDGTGGAAAFNAIQFDWFAGNTLLQVNPANPTQGHILYQANINGVQSDSGGSVTPSGAGSFLTVLSSFDVNITLTGTEANFTIVPNSGILTIWADNERGDNLSGTGFANDANAVLILTASLTSGSGNFDFTTAPNLPLDLFLSSIGGAVPEAGGDNYPGVTTRVGEGASQIQGTITQLNANYFLNLALNTSLVFNNASSVDPFRQANPSNAFSTNALTDANLTNVITGGSICGPGGLANCVNGTGFNILTQSDANSTFTIAPGVVPEPATLTLLGLGLLGAVAVRRRAKK